MSPFEISGIVFVCIFGGAILGLIIRSLLPAHHLSSQSQDVVKLGMGLIATMSALVLGLLVASAKGSFDAQRNEVTQVAANLIFVDRVLARYGPETKEIRAQIRAEMENAFDRIWPKDGTRPGRVEEGTTRGEKIFDRIVELSPKTVSQRMLQAQALKIHSDLAQTRWLLFAQRDSSIPIPFLVVLVFWLTIIFASFSLFAPVNATVIVTLFVCALSVAGAILLILELDRPFAGIIQISSTPLRNALEQMGR
jgi:hypothetical protein